MGVFHGVVIAADVAETASTVHGVVVDVGRFPELTGLRNG